MKIYANQYQGEACRGGTPLVTRVTIESKYGAPISKILSKAEALELAADLIHYATNGSATADAVRDMARAADRPS